MRVLWMMLIVVGCGNPNYPPVDSIESEFRVCQVRDDCVILELGCCDSCNGGVAVAVTRGEEEAALDKYGEVGCGGDCALLGCNDLVAECHSELCVVDDSARRVDP